MHPPKRPYSSIGPLAGNGFVKISEKWKRKGIKLKKVENKTGKVDWRRVVDHLILFVCKDNFIRKMRDLPRNYHNDYIHLFSNYSRCL